MNPALVVRFRPLGPWRMGPDSGVRDRVDTVYHSDTLFSALTGAMLRLGLLDEWLDATVRAPAPAVRLTSCFPYIEETHFIAPPRILWPPPPSPKVRWANARFVPLALVRDLVAGKPLNDDRWYVDGPSACLLAEGGKFRSGPFRIATRSHAAVDRIGASAVAVHRTACLEFAEGAGLWTLASFADDAAFLRWAEPLRGAFRLLADTGLGGERSLGWGRSDAPEMFDGALPDLILSDVAPPPPENGEPPIETVYWLLSLFSPGPEDAIDWRRGGYSLLTRAGRVESPVRSGEVKKYLRMVEEGSVLAAAAEPHGAAPDVAPEGFPHPVYRSGFAVSIPIPVRHPERALSSI